MLLIMFYSGSVRLPDDRKRGPVRGKLAGTYVGASGSVAVGVGVGASILFGGTGRLIALQPLSVQGSVGINLSLAVSGLTLASAQ